LRHRLPSAQSCGGCPIFASSKMNRNSSTCLRYGNWERSGWRHI